ncbi:hypothetical protein FOXYSP1_19801 [Fusarium oxysporum f. sp. phaseoli]
MKSNDIMLLSPSPSAFSFLQSPRNLASRFELTTHTALPAALPTNQMQSNKLPNKSIKYPKILFQIKQIGKLGFEMTFDIF